MNVSSCLCGDFEFYVTYNSVTTQVYPTNFLETALVDELERDQVFYRRKFSGSLIFGGQLLKDDFDYFWAIEQADPFTRLYITIYKNDVAYWQGYFSTSNGTFDIDACTFKITPLSLDNYTDLLDGGNVEHNILSTGIISEVTSIYYNGIDTINYDHCRMLIDVIEYLFQEIVNDPLQTVDSTFFEEAINPVTLLSNHYKYITIAQKSDIKYPEATNNATVGMMSFNQVMQICRCMNLYWMYDGSSLRIEHISYWSSDEGLDVKTQRITQGTNKYHYTNETMPKYERFSWMEASGGDFIGYPIWYDSDGVNQDPDTNTTEFHLDVTTDIQHIIDTMADNDDKESLISNDGWVLLANRLDGVDLYIYFGSGALSGTYFNIDFAWSRLHEAFFKHDRQLPTGYMNSVLTTFYTSKKIRQQEDFSIINCDDFDPTEYISTELGDDYFGGVKGHVKRSVISPYGHITLSLLYGYLENENTGLTADKSVIIVEKLTGATETTYYALLSETEAVDLTITLQIYCQDATDEVCVVAPAPTIVVTAGNVEGNTAVTWCNPLNPPPIRVYAAGVDNIAPLLGWKWGYIIADPDARD